MVTLLYKGKQIGPICRSIANVSGGKIQALADSQVPYSSQLPGTVIRWDSRLPTISDKQINPPSSVVLSRNKKASRVQMGTLCPKTWTSWLHQRKQYTYPCIVRPRRHYAAQGFKVCHNLREVEDALKKFGYQKWYISPVIQKELEYRIFVFQGRIVKAVRRFHKDPNIVAWNIANGGGSVRLLRTSWPITACQAAIQAGVRLNLDWFAADVIIDKATNTPYVLELNTAPGLQEPKTYETLAKVFTWAGENDKPSVGVGETWQDLIHPALLKQKKSKGEKDESEED